ncbi:EcsC family protein [Nocardioides ultimimeridianus]
MDIVDLSDYDRAAWAACMDAVYASGGRRLVPARMRELGGRAGQAVTAGYEKLPLHDHADRLLEKAFDGAMAVTFRPALRSVSSTSMVKRAAKRHPEVVELKDLRELLLADCDRLRRSRLGLTLATAAEGGASSLAVTGAEVATTVSGGTTAAVAIAAIAADVTATMAAMGRAIGSVASAYGYDVREPEEELFALGVMSLASAGTLGGKTAAMASLSRLTQQMMRQATWQQLRQNLLVSAIDRTYTTLGFTLTKKKLAQAVPIAGIALNAGVNAGLVNQTFKQAEAVYRLRFLSDKYGIDPAAWQRDQIGQTTDAEDVVQVDEELAWVVEHDHPAGALGSRPEPDDEEKTP